uniref:Protein E6 n=1 Tax=Human papillomavirus TaxID=10566 RepID=A0A385PKV9_9PAPI|nr:MAG: E6 protein [Human papillomavirus]
MDRPEKPRTVQELSASLQVPVGDLLLKCKFCERFLCLIELLQFDYKALQLIWIDDFAYGCCSSCAYASAAFELKNYLEKFVIGREIEQETGQGIGFIVIRCVFCLKRLDLLEKLDICCRHQHFYKVRGNWKGVCRHCGSIE